MTLYFSAVAFAPERPGRAEYVPGGRWERILRALAAADGRPLTASQAWARARKPDLAQRLDRTKVLKSLKLMRDAGLVAHAGEGWVITCAGLAALDAGEGA